MWFNVNDRWCVNMNEVQYFGAPKNDPTQITIKFKNNEEEINFGVGEKQMETLNEMCKFVKPLSTIIPDDEGELPYGLV